MAYSANTIRRVEQIIGYGLSDVSGERNYTPVDGILYTDAFEGDATLTGYTGTFVKRFNGKQGMTFFNEIILSGKCLGEVTVNAAWGSNDLECELKPLLDWVEADDPNALIDDAGVASKKIEDFSVSFRDSEETKAQTIDGLISGYGFYIRRPFILDVSEEHRRNERYF